MDLAIHPQAWLHGAVLPGSHPPRRRPDWLLLQQTPVGSQVPAFAAHHCQSSSIDPQLPWELLLLQNGADVLADPLHADCLQDRECVHSVKAQGASALAAVDLNQSRLAHPSCACGFALPAGPDCYPRLAESDCLRQLTAGC